VPVAPADPPDFGGCCRLIALRFLRDSDAADDEGEVEAEAEAEAEDVTVAVEFMLKY